MAVQEVNSTQLVVGVCWGSGIVADTGLNMRGCCKQPTNPLGLVTRTWMRRAWLTKLTATTAMSITSGNIARVAVLVGDRGA